MIYFTSKQLATAAGRSVRTIRHHVEQGWLKPEEKAPGVRGHRFKESTAKKWPGLHYSDKKLPS